MHVHAGKWLSLAQAIGDAFQQDVHRSIAMTTTGPRPVEVRFTFNVTLMMTGCRDISDKFRYNLEMMRFLLPCVEGIGQICIPIALHESNR